MGAVGRKANRSTYPAWPPARKRALHGGVRFLPVRLVRLMLDFRRVGRCRHRFRRRCLQATQDRR